MVLEESGLAALDEEESRKVSRLLLTLTVARPDLEPLRKFKNLQVLAIERCEMMLHIVLRKPQFLLCGGVGFGKGSIAVRSKLQENRKPHALPAAHYTILMCT